MKSIAEKSLEFTSLFEAELLVQLMLINWNHPLATDTEFASDLLEDAAAFLRDACAGTQLIEDFAAEHLNFVAAVWYAEWVAVNSGGPEVEDADRRGIWLDVVKRALHPVSVILTICNRRDYCCQLNRFCYDFAASLIHRLVCPWSEDPLLMPQNHVDRLPARKSAIPSLTG